MTLSASLRQVGISPLPASTSMLPANCRQTSVRSAGPLPCRTAMLSATSSALPMLWPRGLSISVMSAATLRPCAVPMATIWRANSWALARSFMKAPAPIVTSSKMAAEPAASFLDMMDDVMSGRESIVAVTSRSA